jgi:hypothetical protein
VRSLIVSDLHLGSGTRSDLLRRPELRASLLAAATDVDRLVLLGDVIELRHGPPGEAMLGARAFFEAIGKALPDLELVLVAGNHDHALIEPWLARRAEEPHIEPLGLSHVMSAHEASPGYERIARWSEPAAVRVAYPGLWVRGDVYATHGHYLDCHLTVPTLERLSMAAMARVLRMTPDSLRSVSGYESVGAPAFAWRDAVARTARTGSALNGLATVGAWRALGGVGPPDGAVAEGASAHRWRSGLASRLRKRALVAGFPLAVAALNRAGLGPLRAEISPTELRRAGLAAMGEVAARLGLGDAHVVFGHTHRPGPLLGDAPDEWLGRAGARLVNTGNWTYASVFLDSGAGRSPYWPGTAVLVEDSGAPAVLSLLADRSRAQIKPGRGKPAQPPA